MQNYTRFALAALPAALIMVSNAAQAAEAWKEGTSYAAGAIVSYAGSDYQALVPHFSVVGANWNPASTSSLWKLVGASAITATAAPKVTPTVAPKVTPTVAPKVTPTVAPKVTPTIAPKVTPTVAPTVIPTAAPKVTPTATPTNSTAGVCAELLKWDVSKSYSAGSTISYAGAKYSAKWWTQGDTPSSTSVTGPWKYEGDCPVPTPTPVGMTPAPTASPAPTLAPGQEVAAPAKPEVGAYFAQWGVYERNYFVADIISSGAAANLTFINYAFGNIYQKNNGYECGMVNKLEPGASDPSAPGAGTGGDSWADYQYTPKRRVNPADAIKWEDNLAGNFREFRDYKKQFPNTKLFISLGGWTWSKWFSEAAKTDALRKQLVKSCLDVYIRGNLPVVESRGGIGVAANIFDGIDIDWEFPGIQGVGYNTFAPEDKQNYTLLLAEFRKQLDALSVETNRKLYLTAAIGVGRDKIEQTEPREYSRYLDWVNLMTYDYNGAWNPKGPTDFQSHIYPDPNSPQYKCPGKPTDKCYGDRSLVSYYNTDDAVNLLINAGMNPKKMVLGIPFYGRGWTGVTNFSNGVYQAATGAAKGTYEDGSEDFKVLKGRPGSVYVHPVTKGSYKFDGSTFWTFDSPEVIQSKLDYAKSKGLNGGAFAWSLDGDDSSATLSKAIGKAKN